MNTIGKIFCFTGFGESHGAAVGGVIDGMPAGVRIDLGAVQRELDRRRPGQSAVTTARKESDTVEVLSGLMDGVTTGCPIGFIIRNSDQHSGDYDHLRDAFRPSHADYTYTAKYGLRDHRGGGRSSARETATRVVAGAFARQALEQSGITIRAYTSQVGSIEVTEPYTSLNARLAEAMMSINASKGFEYGMGFKGVELRGSEAIDCFVTDDDGHVHTVTNRSGGIQGGISNGEDIYFRVAFKPVATLIRDVPTIDSSGNPVVIKGKGRHDPCVVPRAVPVVEAMAAMVILDALLLNRAAKI